MSIAEKFEVIADAVYEKGKKDEYDKFWDNYQNYGKRTDYGYATFSGYGFNFDNFYPKYDIKPIGNINQMFYAWENTTTQRGSLKQRLEECGVTLDTSQAIYFQDAFSWGQWTELPAIDMTAETQGCNNVFARCRQLHTIEKLIIGETTYLVASMFTNDTALENLTIEGTIAGSRFDVKSCTKLTVASLLSILTALSKDSTIASGKSITFATVHQAVIEADSDCLEQLNLAISAGWTVAYA